jgi:hypothetical protein
MVIDALHMELDGNDNALAAPGLQWASRAARPCFGVQVCMEEEAPLHIHGVWACRGCLT